MELLDYSKKKAEKWLGSSVIDAHMKEEIKILLTDTDPQKLINSFYKELAFGTGGLRGIMGVGANCINRYTIGAATQGLSNYLLKTFPNQAIKVAIAYDSRNNSQALAQVTADVFSANGITVYLFSELRPTPLLSFAIRKLQCQSGVVITASHNPKEYNGYKAYWGDGAQLVPPHDTNVISEVSQISDFNQIKFNANPSKILFTPPEVENAYYQEVLKLIPQKESIQQHKDIPIVYSSIHGAGITVVPECLKRLGFENIQLVEEQRKPDGNFPTVESPNPEEQSAMALALKKATQINAELVMATDPDTDRVGIGIKNKKNDFFLLNGNQAFSLMIWFILKNTKNRSNSYLIKTIVTTELVDQMAKKMGITCYNTLTGFKYIAELIRSIGDKQTFIAAGEESYGYMLGDFVRDKDAVSACAFFATMAAVAKQQGQSLYDWLLEMYIEFGFYKESLINIVRKGAQGEQEINNLMNLFRESTPTHIAGERIVRKLDYKAGEETDLLSGKKSLINLPKSDVLQFYTESENKISIRPSGTEPKIKFYISIKGILTQAADYEKISEELDRKITAIGKELISL